VERRWLVAAVAYAAVIFFVSSRPFLTPPGPEFAMKDSLAHALEYAVLAVLVWRVPSPLARPDAATSFLLVVAVCASVAAADELFQATVPGRVRDVGDWMSDVTGAALAAAACARRGRRPPLAEGAR
jgi:VanZ family protein